MPISEDFVRHTIVLCGSLGIFGMIAVAVKYDDAGTYRIKGPFGQATENGTYPAKLHSDMALCTYSDEAAAQAKRDGYINFVCATGAPGKPMISALNKSASAGSLTVSVDPR